METRNKLRWNAPELVFFWENKKTSARMHPWVRLQSRMLQKSNIDFSFSLDSGQDSWKKKEAFFGLWSARVHCDKCNTQNRVVLHVTCSTSFQVCKCQDKIVPALMDTCLWCSSRAKPLKYLSLFVASRAKMFTSTQESRVWCSKEERTQQRSPLLRDNPLSKNNGQTHLPYFQTKFHPVGKPFFNSSRPDCFQRIRACLSVSQIWLQNVSRLTYPFLITDY